MSKIDEARAGLHAFDEYWGDGGPVAPEIGRPWEFVRAVLDALDAAEADAEKSRTAGEQILADALRLGRERDEALEVLAGADHTAAKYWRRMTESERERDELADHLVKTGEDADQYMRERDESVSMRNRAYRQRDDERAAKLSNLRALNAALAVIERVRVWAGDEKAGPITALDAILNTVPADALRAVKAEALREVAEQFPDNAEDAGVKPAAVRKWLNARAHRIETKEQSA